MKRKIFTFVAALALTAGTVLPVSAAERTFKVPSQECTKPVWICHFFCRPCPDTEETPSVPETPDTEETPSVPETPDQEQTPAPEQPDQEQTPEVKPDTMQQLEWAAANLINEIRLENGLKPYEISGTLSAKARIKAQDMKDNGYFSHTSPTYGSPFAMMQTLGISYRSAAENIAMGYRTAEAVVNAWMNSPSHRANILSSIYDTMGIGHTDGYWAQWFIRN